MYPFVLCTSSTVSPSVIYDCIIAKGLCFPSKGLRNFVECSRLKINIFL